MISVFELFKLVCISDIVLAHSVREKILIYILYLLVKYLTILKTIISFPTHAIDSQGLIKLKHKYFIYIHQIRETHSSINRNNVTILWHT